VAPLLAIPSPERIDREWLTRMLHDAGFPGVAVRGFAAERIGTGQLGRCFRYRLDLDGAGPEVPRSLVGKFPSDDATSQATGVALGLYRKEVEFYRTLVKRLRISTPRCYYAAVDGRGPDFALMLEDMAPARQGDQIAGCSAEIARAAVLELVGLHAPTWNDASLLALDWVTESPGTSRAFYAQTFPGFVKRYGELLEPDVLAILGRVVETSGPPFDYAAEPFSVVHVDYRLDNLLIDESRTPPRVTAVDWQSFVLGPPLSDVAYCLGASLLPELRREVEREIVQAYHARLVEAGVRGYDWERCWADYRRGAFAGFAVTVIASMIVQQTPRGDEMFLTMARRHGRHAIDLDAEEFLTPCKP
jgi:hypothetical protein